MRSEIKRLFEKCHSLPRSPLPPLKRGVESPPFPTPLAHARKGYRGIRGIFAEQVYRGKLFKRPLTGTSLGSLTSSLQMAFTLLRHH
jgi:hypothetical protein